MNPVVRLITPRLILRTVTMDDIRSVASSWKLDDGLITLDEAKAKINTMISNHEKNQPGALYHLCLAIIEKETLDFIGWCGLDKTEENMSNPVLFYLLKSHYWGKGLATESAQAIIEYAFSTLNLDRIDGATDFSNLASKRVMEKSGMHYLGLDAEGGHFFSLSKADYSDQILSNNHVW